MKGLIFIVSMLLFWSTICPSAAAQIGIKAGAGVADIAFLKDGQTPYLGYEINALEHRIPRAFFQAGAFRQFELSQRFYFQPELLYSLQGLNYNTSYLYDDITYKINLQYIRMPLLVQYKTSIKKKNYPALFIGPYAAWKLKAVRVKEVEGVKENNNFDNVKSTDFGAILGFSYNYKLPDARLIIDLRSSYSFVNMMDRIEGYTPWYYGPEKEYARNVTIAISVGYYFENFLSIKKERSWKK